ncbi:DMT family transporter [Kroppenstedtia eburnea]|uniref:DMT family transporter n=2 Tax=Kroppenstedtia TaxID=1274351 RepID=A0ABW4CDS2_9BACL|nr:DMT family transporter [Kroppenstedtia guangzhouensis]EGK11232.1 hypothetical protein HMPREF9374_2050 [Desmospora sp. 8437]GGA50415.1 putative transporter YetK [Kroppenstedtia guangzhouensis]
MSKDRMIAYIQMGSAMAIVGSLVTASKMTVDRIPPHLASELRFIVAAAVLILLLYQREGGFHFRRNRPHLSLLFWQAFFGTYLFNLCLMYGVRWTTGVESGIITSFTPAAVGLLSFLLLRERPGWIRWVGILFVVLGTGVIQVPGAAGGDGQGTMSLWGNLLVLAAVISEGFFITLGKKSTNHVSPLYVSTLVSLYGVLLFLPGTLEELRHFDWAAVPWEGWALILYNALIVTVVGFLLMYAGVSRLPASSAGLMTGLMPVSAVLLSALLLGEPVTWIHGLGILAVLTGIALISQEKEPEPMTAE